MKRLAMVTLAAVFLCNSNLQTALASATKSTWATDSIQAANDAGLISDALTKKIDEEISRLDFCKMAMQFYKKTGKELQKLPEKSPFSDCDDPDALQAYTVGFVSGVEKDKFFPEKSLTREQLAILTVRLLDACGLDLMPYAKQVPFSDTKKLPESSKKYVQALYGAGLVSGYTDGSFRPLNAVQTKEALVVLDNALKFYEKKSGIALKEETQKKSVEKLSVEPEAKPDKEKTLEKSEVKEESNKEQKIPITQEGHHLTLSGKEIVLGQSQEDVKKIWGEPTRIDHSVYDLERYIYQPNAKQYLTITFQNEKVVAIFAVADEFSYNGIENIRTQKNIAEYSRFSDSSNYAVWNTKDAEISFCVDFQGNIRGASLRETAFAIGEGLKISSDIKVYSNVEKELLESINTLRAINERNPLEWDEYLHVSAMEHSKDMVNNRYFAYNGLDGKTPFQRMYEKEKDFRTAAEVIARVKGDVPELYTEMIRTAGKYHSILDETMSHGGIGVAITSNVASVTVDMCGF